MKTFHKIYSFLAAAALMVGSLGFTACSDDDDDTITGNKDGVELTYFGTMPATRGETIEIHGKNLNKVKAVVFPIEEKVTDFTLKGNDVIIVTVPEEALAGHLRLLTSSDETVTSKSRLSYDEEITVSSITPTEGLLPGDVVTITGDCVYNVASVTFGGGVEVPSTEFVSASRRELKVAVPREAQSGSLIISDGNEDEPWEYISEVELKIASPEVTSLDKTDYNFMEKMVITGKHLQYVDKITFPTDVVLEKDEFTVAEDGTTITLEVPDECDQGVLTLTLANGLTIESPAFTLPVITVDRVLLNGSEIDMTALIEDLEVGNELRFEGRNLDAVRRIILPNTAEKFKNYTLEGSTAITFNIPAGYQDGNLVFYQNPSKSLSFATSMLVELPYIWKGSVKFENWGGNLPIFDWNPSLWKKFYLREGAVNKPGKMTFMFNILEEDAHLLKLTYGDWVTPWVNAAKDPAFNPGGGGIDISPDAVNYKIEVTQEDIDQFAAGFVIYGTGLELTAIRYEQGEVGGGDEPVTPTEKEIQVFTDVVDIDMGTSLGAFNLECKPATSLIDAGLEPGNKLRFYITPTAEYNMEYPAVIVKIFDGHWGALEFPDLLVNFSPNTAEGERTTQFNEVSWGDMTKIDIPVTTDLYKALQNTDWGYGLILQGQNLIFNKIVLVQ